MIYSVTIKACVTSSTVGHICNLSHFHSFTPEEVPTLFGARAVLDEFINISVGGALCILNSSEASQLIFT